MPLIEGCSATELAPGWPRHPSAAGPLLGRDRNTLHLLLGLLGLGQHHTEYAIFKVGAHPIALHLDRKGDVPLEAPIEALADVAALVFGLAFALSADCERAVIEKQLDVLLLHAR